MHHICVLMGYGADAVCPYLALETLNKIRANINSHSSPDTPTPLSEQQVVDNFKQACAIGIMKVLMPRTAPTPSYP